MKLPEIYSSCAGLRNELTTCNQALEAAQAKVGALEKVAEAARGIFTAHTTTQSKCNTTKCNALDEPCPADSKCPELPRLLQALAALDVKEGDNG